MLKLLVCLLLFLATVIVPFKIAYAQDINVSGGQVSEALNHLPHVRFLPSSPAYLPIKIKEAFGRFFTSSAVRRAEFDFMISGKRVKEAYLLSQESKSLQSATDGYSRSTKKCIEQLKKAKGQNQEIAPVVDEIVSDLNYHEVLLVQMEMSGKSNSSLNDNFESFVEELELLKPGTKQKFKFIKEPNEQKVVEQSPTPTPVGSTSGANPKRIIY